MPSRRLPLPCVAAMLLLAPLGCARACLGGSFPSIPEPPVEPDAASRPPPGPEAPPSQRCSLEEAQRLTALLERERAPELRELADRSGGGALAMVPLRLAYDGAGRVEAARFRLDGYAAFAQEVEKAASGWRLDGVHQAATCEVAIRLPRADEDTADAGRGRRRPGMKAPVTSPPTE